MKTSLLQVILLTLPNLLGIKSVKNVRRVLEKKHNGLRSQYFGIIRSVYGTVVKIERVFDLLD